MIDAIIRFSIRNRFLILIFAALLVGAGLWAARQLPIDAVPDITTKQVVVNTSAPALGPEDIERQITFPLEVALGGLPHVQVTRSISQFGLSQVTVVFDDNTDIYLARQLVNERLQAARDQLPPGVLPEMGPIATGLGEIYNIELKGDRYSLMQRRTMMDWIVRPQLRTVRGLSEVNVWGGLQKQYQVLVDPNKLLAYGLTVRDVFRALAANNQNAGGGYVTRGDEQQVVGTVGILRNLDDIRRIVVGARDGVPITIAQVATVTEGGAIRQGAVTQDGRGEQVYAIAMLLIGDNGRIVVQRVKDRLVQIQKSLPAGTKLVGFLDRSQLIDRTIHTAVQNLIEGSALVILVLFLFLLQLRAGLIVSSAIPLAMLCAILGMWYFGVSANLMSLGAIDFGLIVDGAVIIVENCIRRLANRRKALGRGLTEPERLETIEAGAIEVRRASQFGEMIIIAAYLPILTLMGIEGKMFRPMGLTVIFALLGALILTLTLIPALCALFLRDGKGRTQFSRREARKSESAKADRRRRGGLAVARSRSSFLFPLSRFRPFALPCENAGTLNAPAGPGENPLVRWLSHAYEPALRWAMRHRAATAGGALLFFIVCAALFPLLGSEFIPTLNEGALLIEANYAPSISLAAVIERAGVLERRLREQFPNEVDHVVTRIGRAEIAGEPNGVNQTDVLVSLKPRRDWKRARTQDELTARVARALDDLPGVSVGISQPIKGRMSELIEGTGLRTDLGIKIFGSDRDVLAREAPRVARIVASVRGAADVRVQTTQGLPSLRIRIRRGEIARYGINVADVNDVVQAAVGGQAATVLTTGAEQFDLVVRLAKAYRSDPAAIGRILVPAPNGVQVPLSQLADIESVEGPVQISRENGQRLVVVQANVRGRDLGSFVQAVQRKLEAHYRLPVGYHLEYGGTYEQLQAAQARLRVVVPITFGLIFLLLFATFNSLRQAALVFTGVPLAVTGGVLSLLFRGMPFSISAGIGFIALFGVAVLNGVVLVTFINELREQGAPVREAVVRGSLTRLRPVLMTAAVASIGFIPMATSHGAGAEVQRPLATVVIGGLITSTLLTLFVLPTLYAWFEREPIQAELEG